MATTQPIQTPKGNLAWVIISGEGKENLSGRMKYTADLVLPSDSDEAKKLSATIDKFWAENKPNSFPAKKKAKSLGYRPEMRKVLDENGEDQYDEEGEIIKEPTGNTVFSFATDTTYGKSGDAKVIKVYNAKGNRVSLGDKKIGNGSVGQIGGAMGVYSVKDTSGKISDAGVTLYLNSIRITKFVEYTDEDNWAAEDGDDGWTGEDNWDAESQESEQQQSGGTPRL